MARSELGNGGAGHGGAALSIPPAPCRRHRGTVQSHGFVSLGARAPGLQPRAALRPMVVSNLLARAWRREDERKTCLAPAPTSLFQKPEQHMGVFAPFPRDGDEQMTGCEHVLVPPTHAPASFPLRAAVAPDPNVGSFQLANGRGEGFLGDTLSKSSSITCHSRSSCYPSPREALLKIKSSSSPGRGGRQAARLALAAGAAKKGMGG